MKFIVGKKLNMTQFFAENGEVIPVTVVKAPEIVVTQVKTGETKDGYNAVQVGVSPLVSGSRHSNKAKTGHSKDLGIFGKFVEFRLENSSEFQVGQKIDVSTFEVGEMVNVTGTMKGRGFTGVMKRHGFAGFPGSHGHDKPRSVGSIGSRYPQHVNKGRRMAGHMGNSQVTVKNLQIVDVDTDKGLILVKGAVPGHPNGMVKISTTGVTKPLFQEVVETKKKK
ncbi:MAG TPA: 50S ribosomal protein L3 [Candidatus Doudnabacteria bacterium]|nr:50S ribosomal protein L3 [Candidatus Doudnabacteria bacterium]